MPLKELKQIKNTSNTLEKFITRLNLDIEELNKLILTYNQITAKDEAINKLKEIWLYKQFIENKYSSVDTQKCPEFATQIQEQLFLDIKKEFADQEITNLATILDGNNPLLNCDFSIILANMPPKKLNNLISILSMGSNWNKNSFSSLYLPSDEYYAEFNHFLTNNQFSFLGGGNSKNFKITPGDGSPPYVLKLDNRLGMPKLTETHLRNNALQETVTPVVVERQGTTTLIEGKLITRNVLITEFCAGGDLATPNPNHRRDLQKHAKAAISIYEQMVTTLISIGHNGCAFPDMKNANWLIDHKGKLLIADTKSFIFCENDGNMDYDKTIEKTRSFIITDFINPQEYDSQLTEGRPVSADKWHACILGLNLYQYMTQCSTNTIEYNYTNKNDINALSFTHAIFKTNEGKRLATLIKNLIQKEPADRISLETTRLEFIEIRKMLNLSILEKIAALGYTIQGLTNQEFVQQQKKLMDDCGSSEELERINVTLEDILTEHTLINSGQKENLNILKKIKTCGLGNNDVQMQQFIDRQKNKIHLCTSSQEIDNIKQELTTILNQQTAAKEVKKIVKKFRHDDGFFTVGMKKKAGKIERAICAIPIEDRVRITDKSYNQGMTVQLAIASHRLFKFAKEVKIKDGEIKEKSAAPSYRTFKNKLNDIKKWETTLEKDDKNHIII